MTNYVVGSIAILGAGLLVGCASVLAKLHTCTPAEINSVIGTAICAPTNSRETEKQNRPGCDDNSK